MCSASIASFTWFDSKSPIFFLHIFRRKYF
jgi:hypothetical protein